MLKYGRAAGTNSGFTLLEVILASVILATCVAAVVTIYVRTAEKAADARDLTVAASTARNAMEESFADYAQLDISEGGAAVEGAIPERPSLTLFSWRSLPDIEVEIPLTDDFYVDVSAEGVPLLAWRSMRAVYFGAAEVGEGAAEEVDDESE